MTPKPKAPLSLSCAKLAMSLGFAALAIGCHSAFVQATVVNNTGQTVRLFEVDYPSASFGGQDLANGATFHYRFKILGSGPVKMTWTDSAEHEHTVTGPTLQEGQEGPLLLTINPATATWNTRLHEVH